ncbi:phosphatase PAP2 family protein [Mycobacterium sp. M1]|uniref:Phosphatase PAP2 family protein n=1 Tax=Mycolicibacter acidiphilus TaxID=2835306 RepID=A0ABS5RNC5_9MYCO|nr:phosphatase PAP2 family protein [Mycolicibacter acidiphilus]MBS9535815.1 phosphatase PAP2 family protein [Mycolicibacter acidiphilus]
MTRWLIPPAAIALYVSLWVGYVQGWGWLTTVDGAALDAGHRIGMKYPDWVPFWDGVSTVFEPTMFRVLAMLAAALTLFQRRLRAALFVLVTVEPVGLLTQAAKDLADRPRPVTAMAAATSSSFPSGHALGAIVGVAALLAVAWPLLHGRARLFALCAGALVVLSVGVARVALNVHHPSDVLAGWALGWLYFSVWAALLKPWADGG